MRFMTDSGYDVDAYTLAMHQGHLSSGVTKAAHEKNRMLRTSINSREHAQRCGDTVVPGADAGSARQGAHPVCQRYGRVCRALYACALCWYVPHGKQYGSPDIPKF